MKSPYIVTIIRRRKHEPRNRRSPSIRGLSQEYFRTECIWSFVIELLLFGLLVAISLWPIIDTVKALRLL